MRKIENYKIIKIVIGTGRNGLSDVAKPIADGSLCIIYALLSIVAMADPRRAYIDKPR